MISARDSATSASAEHYAENRQGRRHNPPPRVARWMFLSACVAGSTGHAVDFSSWAQRVQHHGHWLSVEFRDPVTGMFVVSRAGTADATGKATLTLTANPATDCSPEVVIVLERETPARRDRDHTERAHLQIDEQAPRNVRVRVVEQKGDRFRFFQILDRMGAMDLRGHHTVTFRIQGVLRAEFPLDGFEEAWDEAWEVCSRFLPS